MAPAAEDDERSEMNWGLVARNQPFSHLQLSLSVRVCMCSEGEIKEKGVQDSWF